MGYGQKRGGAPGGSSIVSCEVLHSRGGENDTRGGECPSPPPLKYGPELVYQESRHRLDFVRAACHVADHDGVQRSLFCMVSC